MIYKFGPDGPSFKAIGGGEFLGIVEHRSGC